MKRKLNLASIYRYLISNVSSRHPANLRKNLRLLFEISQLENRIFGRGFVDIVRDPKNGKWKKVELAIYDRRLNIVNLVQFSQSYPQMKAYVLIFLFSLLPWLTLKEIILNYAKVNFRGAELWFVDTESGVNLVPIESLFHRASKYSEYEVVR